MRVLVMTIPAYGHLLPVVPLARALVDAGHEVAVVTAGSFGDVVADAGLPHLPAGIGLAEASVAAFERHPEYAAMSEAERSQRVVADVFVDEHAQAVLADAAELIAWCPDVVIREEGEFAAPVLAELLGIPCMEVGWGPMRPPELVAAAAAALAPLYERVGLRPPADGGMHRRLYLDPCPPTLQLPYARGVSVRRALRPVTDALRREPPEWLSETAGPLVYISLGTVPAFSNDTELLLAAIDALAGWEGEVCVSLEPGARPDSLGPQPADVHVERFPPQRPILERAVAMVSHGGSGSMLAALSAGVPLLVVPGNAPSLVRNAEAIAASGAGRVLARGEAGAARLRDELRALAAPGPHRAAAQLMATEIARMPSPREVVPVIERLVHNRIPHGRGPRARAERSA